MTTEEIKDWIRANLIRENGTLISVRCSYRWISKNSEEVCEVLRNFEKPYHNCIMQNILYDFLNDITEQPKCSCGRPCKYMNFGYGYGKHCSSKCSGADEKVKERQKQTFLEKYGAIHPMRSEKVKEKQKKTFFERTGYDHNFKLPTAHHEWPSYERRKEIIREKYGVDNPFQIDFVKEKIKQTTKERYGSVCYTASEEGRKKFLKTRRSNMLEKFKYWISLKQLELLDEKAYLDGELPRIKCLLCSTEFEAQSSTAAVVRCPICSKTRESREEFVLRELLNSKGFNFQRDTKVISPLELDMYEAKYRLGVEFNGLYWHSELYKDPDYHLDKLLKCHENGIQLIQIFENEWINYPEKVKSTILKAVGCANKIDACERRLEPICDEMLKQFIKENSLETYEPNFTECCGLFFEDELVATCAFKKVEDSLELVNVCEHIKYKIDNYVNIFTNLHANTDLFVKCNRRFLTENNFIDAGFFVSQYLKPSFKYWKKNSMKILKNPINEIKKAGTWNSSLSIDENMRNNDYFKIYDCGYTILRRPAIQDI